MDNDIERIINLKEEEFFIKQYINLRNSYTELLLTSVVNISETKEWLKREDIEIRGIVKNKDLLGVVILYINKNGEIAFFVKNKNRGIGTKLLHIAEEIAKKNKLPFIWSWVIKDNFIAHRTFRKEGFIKEGITEREYRSVIKQGIKYRKILEYEICNKK